MADPTRVLVVDDQPLFRQIVRQAFAAHPSIRLIGEAADAEQALALARRLEPNVVLMDLGLPDADGVEATRRLRAALPSVQVLAVTASDDQERLVAALHAGAKPKGTCLRQRTTSSLCAPSRRSRPARASSRPR
jgi:DNA-binding NarL/FixJ family response regulator